MNPNRNPNPNPNPITDPDTRSRPHPRARRPEPDRADPTLLALPTNLAHPAGVPDAAAPPAAPRDTPGARRRSALRRRARWALAGLGIAAIALAAACEASVANGTLTVLGLEQGDEVLALRLAAGAPGLLEVDWGADGSAEYTFDRSTFSRIVVDGRGGNDTIVVDERNGTFTDTEITDLLGGDGDDTLTGGSGAERLDGGPGADLIDGNAGIDSVVGGAGDDGIRWDAGDGNDAVDGGSGGDRFLVTGTDESESYGISTAGRRARLTRDLGAVQLDLTAVETLSVHAASGVDAFAVGDVAPTDLVTVELDLRGAGGADDAVPDEVFLPPGVAIGNDSGTPVVDGLGARLRVTGSNPLSDRLHVLGTAATDAVSIGGSVDADAVSVTASGPDVRIDGATPNLHVITSMIDRTDVDLGAGQDTFTVTGNVAALTSLDVDGGPGADTILGSNGADRLAGGTGADLIDGQQGADVVRGDDGDDVVQWDPGDGSDTVDGGPGTDRMLFNGSSGNERFAFAADSGRVRVTRDLGSIVLDLDAMEAFDLNAFAGTDVVQTGDLTGTDLATVTVNLAGAFGLDDGVVDEVAVAPGKVIRRDGGAAVVDGLGAQVRVVGGSEAIDRIHVTGTAGLDAVPLHGTASDDRVDAIANGTDAAVFGATPGVHVLLTSVDRLDVELGDGADRFTATGNLAALVALHVDGGPGADTLLGSNGADALVGGGGADFIDGQQGVDGIDGGAGDDVVQWDPGDGNDSIVGGAGTDRMVYNGSSIGELLTLSAAGDHVRFTRNVANVVLDLDAVEVFELNVLAGNDIVQVEDLSGTDLRAVDVNLLPFGGSSGDGVADQVVVHGTSADDQIAVTADGPAVVTSGLPAVVRVRGADVDLDLLTVDGRAGADTITSTPEAAARMLLDLLP